MYTTISSRREQLVSFADDSEPDQASGCCKLVVGRLAIASSTLGTILDQLLDGAVLGDFLIRGFKLTALVLAASIVMPQVICWLFLRTNGMSSCRDLLFILVCPTISILVGAASFFFESDPPEVAIRAMGLLMAISIEPLIHLFHDLRTGVRSQESMWTSTCEGLIEAPCSSVLTLYSAILIDAATDRGSSYLFPASVAQSIFMITYASTMLHFYGQTPTMRDKLWFALVHKLPVVAGQVIGYSLFAFLTRPLPQDMDDLRQSSKSYLVFGFVLQAVIINFGILRSSSPNISIGVAIILSCCTLVAGPPGFLISLERVTSVHTVVSSGYTLLGCVVASSYATAGHWLVLREHYMWCCPVFFVATMWSFVANLTLTSTVDLGDQIKMSTSRLLEALRSNDRIMARLSVDVDSAELRGWIPPPLSSSNFISAGASGNSKWYGMTAMNKSLYCCPWYCDTVLVITPTTEDVAKVSHIPTGRSGNGQWNCIAALEGKLYCCGNCGEVLVRDPEVRICAEVLVIDPSKPRNEDKVTFLLFEKRGSSDSWNGIAALNGRLYCCPQSGDDILVIDPSIKEDDQKVTLIPFDRTRTGQGGWIGIVAMSGRLYCCPSSSNDILVIDPSAQDEGQKITFLSVFSPMDRWASIEFKWIGIAAMDGRLYCCPCDVSDVLVIDPHASATKRISFIPTGESGLHLWHFIVEAQGRLYCSPTSCSQVLMIDPTVIHDADKVCLFDIGKSGKSGGKMWAGIAELDGWLYCCPRDADEVLAMKVGVDTPQLLQDKWNQVMRADEREPSAFE